MKKKRNENKFKRNQTNVTKSNFTTHTILTSWKPPKKINKKIIHLHQEHTTSLLIKKIFKSTRQKNNFQKSLLISISKHQTQTILFNIYFN